MNTAYMLEAEPSRTRAAARSILTVGNVAGTVASKPERTRRRIAASTSLRCHVAEDSRCLYVEFRCRLMSTITITMYAATLGLHVC